MDACEMIPLADGSRVSWLRVIDEASGAVLLTRVFPCAHWNEVGKQPVQTFLRDSFYRWGLPQGMRVDHGRPWVSSWGLPSDLELWLAGLAVALHMIRVRCPEDNGTIERSQGTGKRWAEPQCCASPQHLQQRLDEEDRVQREVYRDDQGQTRRERFPGLLNSGRGYAPLWEKYHWDMQAALACLAAHPVKRKVNKQGQVSVYDHHHRVGRDYAEQEVEVRFDTASQQWCFLVGETAVGKCPAFQISQEKIVGLELGSRQGRSARLTAAKKAAEKTNKGP